MLAEEPTKDDMFPPRALVLVLLGKTGAGKTSTINALFNLSLPTDNAVACTKELAPIVIKRPEIPDAPVEGMVVVDTPGLGEDQEADARYWDLYVQCVARADHVLWLLQADTRAFRSDQVALRELFSHMRDDAILTIGLNHVDRIGPGDWNHETNEPSFEQVSCIIEKLDDVAARFSKVANLAPGALVAYSAHRRYGLDMLQRRVFRVVRD